MTHKKQKVMVIVLRQQVVKLNSLLKRKGVIQDEI